MSAFDDTIGSWRRSAAAAVQALCQGARDIIGHLKAVRRGLRGGRDSRIRTRGVHSLSDWQLKDIGMHRSQIWLRGRDISTTFPRRSHGHD